jgi:hypothetical protein
VDSTDEEVEEDHPDGSSPSLWNFLPETAKEDPVKWLLDQVKSNPPEIHTPCVNNISLRSNIIDVVKFCARLISATIIGSWTGVQRISGLKY